METSPASPGTQAEPAHPLRSPSYPQRVHIRERAHWQSFVRHWDERIAAAVRSPRTPAEDSTRLLAQMAGARDQLADAARRMPMEVGSLYEEDHHRLEAAVAALERLFARWDATP